MSTPVVLSRTSRAEWRRIWSVRSSWVLALVTAAAVLGIGTLIGIDIANGPPPPADANAWRGGRPTAMFALFGVLALSVVTATADHGTGGITPTLQWTPRRGVLLAARVGVIAATTTALGVLLVSGASVAVQLLLPTLGLPLGNGAEVLGGLALIFVTGALLGVGTGLALRSTAGGLVTVIGLVLVLPTLLAQLPYDWAVDLSAHLPGSSAMFLIYGEGPKDDMTVASSRITLVAWAVAAVLAGGWRLLRSDAGR